MIRCAHCKDRHETVAEVRSCSLIAVAKPMLIGAKLDLLTAPTELRVLTRVKVTEPGMYRAADQVYLVQWNKAGTQLYARRLVETLQDTKLHKLSFEYDRGAIFRIDSRDRMTLAEVEALGKTSGHCYVCTRKLTVQKSITAGIGPVCAKKV